MTKDEQQYAATTRKILSSLSRNIGSDTGSVARRLLSGISSSRDQTAHQFSAAVRKRLLELKAQGLVAEDRSCKGETRWTITELGTERLRPMLLNRKLRECKIRVPKLVMEQETAQTSLSR
jgi:hypothetical protein